MNKRSKLARQIIKIINKRKLTQKQAAEILEIDQPKISALIRENYGAFHQTTTGKLGTLVPRGIAAFLS